MIIFKESIAVRIISWVLIAALFVSSFTEMAMATDNGTYEKTKTEDEVTEKDIVEKTESSTTYYLGNEKK